MDQKEIENDRKQQGLARRMRTTLKRQEELAELRKIALKYGPQAVDGIIWQKMMEQGY